MRKRLQNSLPRALLLGLVLNLTTALFGQTYDIVFDIDKVLLWRDYEKPEHVDVLRETVVWERSFPSRKGETRETYYIDADLGPVIQKLLSIPGVRVSFMSAHHGERAEKVFPHVLLPDGRSLAEVAYKILGYADITEDYDLNQDAEGSMGFFSSKNGQKKDLLKIVGAGPGATTEAALENTILIDDNPGNAMPGQERNMFPLLEDIPRRPLLVTLGVLETAINISRQTGQGLARMVHSRVFQRIHGRVEPHPDLFERKYLKAGLTYIKGLGNTGFKPQKLKPIAPVRPRNRDSWTNVDRDQAARRRGSAAEEDRPPSPRSRVRQSSSGSSDVHSDGAPENRSSFVGSCYSAAKSFFALFGGS